MGSRLRGNPGALSGLIEKIPLDLVNLPFLMRFETPVNDRLASFQFPSLPIVHVRRKDIHIALDTGSPLFIYFTTYDVVSNK